MKFSSKVLIARLEKSNSLSQIIWISLAVLALVALSLIFYDDLFNQNKFESEYGQYEGKNQSIYLEK